MELIYLWINKTQNNFIEKSGVCFNKSYNILFDVEKRKLSIEYNNLYYNIFENDIISNVSAIVGKNGSGKTTLLNYIYNMEVMPNQKEEREEYLITKKQQEEIERTLQVFRFKVKDKWQLNVYHNFEYDIEVVQKGILISNVNNDEYDFGSFVQSEKELFNITKVYLTNSSYYESNGYYLEYGKTSKVALNISTIGVLSKSFYRKLVGFPIGIIKDNLFYGLQDMIITTKTQQNLQEICDIIYFDYILRKNKTFEGKIQTELHITNIITPKLIHNVPGKSPSTYYSNQDFPSIIKNKIENWKLLYRNFAISYNNIIDGLYLNLLFELYFIDESISSKLKTLKGIEDVIKCIGNYLEHSSIEYKDYYLMAVSEIEEYSKIIVNTHEFNNGWPKDDVAHIYGKVINYENNPDLYLNFTAFINKCAFSEKSFVLKYIKIDNLEMSSGERSYLNFFSWLNTLKFLNHISQEIIKSTKDNILLLIDEIDLYCHPEWQSNFIEFLLDELKNQFSGKRIQVIFTTHSPITLADIPDTNVVYLEKGQVKEKEGKTFGQNIYNLFKDSFYLENTMGKFSERIIGGVYDKLNYIIDNQLSNVSKYYEDIEYCKYIISIIGESVIKISLESKIQQIEDEYKSTRLKNIISEYTDLSKDEKERLIKYIINTNQEDN
ncbi:AAA family ATPase [Clostridium estertheticum]|uniref:AAA family ATPase n=1 Tax=Clostridium estertheticum TaxID=238834 RepID=UPI0013E98372|nr:AAA family ATPase [Clostridium estertheticum]MBZ9688283.1 AAA family ATPase [Clostridium estertheticum]